MAIKRIVDTRFWNDNKVIDTFSVEDKYFLLYLMTNPESTQLGIYKLPKKIISFQTGYMQEVIAVLIQRFETKYKNILYSQKTGEISVINSLKYSIVKGGKPVSDLLSKELNAVEDSELIKETYERMRGFWNKSLRSFDSTIKSLFEEEMKRRQLKSNDNDNDNDNEESYPHSYDESYHESSKIEQSTETPAQQMLNIFNKALGRSVANQGTFSGLVFKNVSVQEFEDVINYVMSWNDDILQNTTASTIARNFDKYSDKASELGYKDGKKPVKKTSNKGYGNKPQRVEPQMITEPVAQSNVDVSDVAKELAELKDMGIQTKLRE